ncbi:RING finger protein 126-B [Culex quinquefasciatus]|uniref:RING-type E3 ubiquitin transferase n=1 Tax=Culex quinquefasciatus TaxID=7176 RepID=B0WSS8_CULQU|nr:E3 ubiquitin-protein ligase Iruka isoform X1 [Culex quinquefasciatus]XP_038120015.1 E3 ubiquitin-protein ligase Iruka isoform X1 [Culex quinquefasciatus]EDS34037.1 RING finger protein 126-B [Culex quinquefasciatus]|eukprot:XP_001870705.1 RING finger protein 126-B [Culex quinquefasciatus]
MEALVENAASPAARFYCHSCSVEIDRVSSDFTCPHCSQGFIEELPAVNNPPSPPPVPPEQDSNDFINPQAIRLASEIFSNSILSPLLLSTSGPRDSDSDGAVSLGDVVGGDAGGGGPTAVRVLGRHRNRGRRGIQNVNNLDNILREILISVADGANGGVGGTPMFFMGNPADYAWGREGLDTIVTQLLNQMDNTGPPPLEKEKIAEIPKVTISAEQVDMKLQCSVCWEDFQIDEVVRKLTCAHVYHETCIIPWLELHGTCPICRKSLAPEQQPDEQRGLAAAANAVANTLRSLHSDAFPGAGASQSSSSSVDEGGPSTSSLHIDFREPLLSFTARAAAGDSNGPTPAGSTSGGGTASSSSNSGTGGGGAAGSSNSRYRDDDGNIDYEFD